MIGFQSHREADRILTEGIGTKRKRCEYRDDFFQLDFFTF